MSDGDDNPIAGLFALAFMVAAVALAVMAIAAAISAICASAALVGAGQAGVNYVHAFKQNVKFE